MTKEKIFLAVILVAAIMFVPVMLAHGVERFFDGIGTMVATWSK